MGRCSLSGGKRLYSPRRWASSPWSQGAVPRWVEAGDGSPGLCGPGPLSCNQKPPAGVLSAPLELPRSGSVRMGREGEGRKKTGFRVYGLIPIGGFNRSEHRAHRLECGFCPFAMRRVRPAMPMPRGGATGGGRVGLQFPPLRLCLLGDGGWSIPATLCTAPLSLILGSAAVCTGHSGRTPTSTPRSAQWGISPRLFTAVGGLGPR